MKVKTKNTRSGSSHKENVIEGSGSLDPDKEYPDQTPIHIPGVTDRPAPLTLRDEMRRYIREQISQAAAQSAEFETFEESDDFDITDEDPDLTSEYTVKVLGPPDEGYTETLDGEPNQEDILHAEQAEGQGESKDSPEDPAPSPEKVTTD